MSKKRRAAEPSAALIAENAPIGILRADEDGRITYINPALERFTGVPLDRALGNDWLDSLDPSARDSAERNWRETLAAKQTFETELRFNHPDGSVRYAAVTVAASEDDSGGSAGFVGFVADITELRSRQRELRRSERLFRALAENATDIIVRLNLDDHIIYASPAMGEITGFSADETKGINPISFMHPDDADVAKERSRQLKAGEIEQALIQYRTPHRAGHFIWVEARSRLVRDGNGVAQEVISVIRDITSQKQLEAELIDARETERQASAAQSRFLAAMSHEIRTPISGVIGMIDLLINTTDDAERPRYRAALASSARTLLRVVDDVLDYSRMSEVGITLEASPFDVFATVHSVSDLYRPAANAKGLELGLQFEASARHAMGDATRLSQILGNLVSNAIKFTDHGRIDMTVRQRGDQWSFSVRDTGIGMSAEQQERLFKAFAQADETIMTRFGGTGLGLVIARMIIDEMGGSIGVESAIMDGACFTFDIQMPTLAEALSVEAETELPSCHKQLRVLVAEDHEVNRLYLTKLLERMGHDVTEVADGRAAVDAARDGGFDVILMDRHMPRLDGESAARMIRDAMGDRPCLLVLVSAAASGGPTSRPVQSRLFDASLPKPVRPEQLAALLAGIAQPMPLSPTPPSTSRDDIEAVMGSAAMAELDRLFRSDLEERLTDIETALLANDWDKLSRGAHAIAGAAGLIGENGLGAVAGAAETALEPEMKVRGRTLLEAVRTYLSIV